VSRFLTALQHIIGYSVPYKLLSKINFTYDMSGNVIKYNYTICEISKYCLQRWAYAFRSSKFHVRINTNKRCGALKPCTEARLLTAYRDTTLSGLMMLLL